jgi:GNAT superfamily N-acetyltransferase
MPCREQDKPSDHRWTMTTTMRIECARDTGRDLTAVHRLIGAASSWLRTKNTAQWAAPWPNKVERDKRIREDLRARRTWIVWDEKIPVATLTTTDKYNADVWAESKCDLSESAVYVHRLVTARSHAGRGLGAEMIDWAGLRGSVEYGAKYIRIDVWTDNAALHEYYKRTGFVSCGFCPDPRYPSGALFAKQVTDIREGAIPLVSGPSAEFDLRPAACYDLVPLS